MTGKETRQKLSVLITEIENKKSELDNLLGASRQISEQLTNVLNDSNTKLTTVVTNEQQSNQKLQDMEQELSLAKNKEEEIKGVADNIIKINVMAKEKNDEIEELKRQTNELLATNHSQSDKISDILQKAAAGTLFEAFKIRKDEHKKSARLWAVMVGVAVVALLAVAGWIIWIVHAKGILSYEFLVKLSISIPLIFWLTFSTRQYTKSKRLEEEYAFKSAVSLSLEAYRDLLKKEAGESTKADVIPLITEAVGKIFSSPSKALAQYSIREDKDIMDSTGNFIDKLLRLVGK